MSKENDRPGRIQFAEEEAHIALAEAPYARASVAVARIGEGGADVGHGNQDPLDGVYRFKKGWGGQVVRTVPAFDRVFIRPAYWFWQWRRGEA